MGLSHEKQLPNGFVYLTDIDPTIIENSRYYGSENFIGKRIHGYDSNKIICTKQAAEQLKRANQEFLKRGYRLVVYDGYRPQRAVLGFISWVKNSDTSGKKKYYPTLKKEDILPQGYIAERSGHSRGSTFDLTLIEKDREIRPITVCTRKLQNGEEIPFLDDNTIDMGSSFDLFHEVSHHDTKLINKDASFRRNLLRSLMKTYGFKEYPQEWWHYTLENEPYSDIYFDF